ncbi:reverse transcriptase domain-containing protein [Paenibacillus ihumii]|uniref:reverse transcriptase domain-containing protein n=1 Tax=Paenibacillus ihumii TaxID=687436 RepID=UPI0006D78F71|nr:reverse transcriptase domain-containing protein [Paenibacillus ihumii]
MVLDINDFKLGVDGKFWNHLTKEMSFKDIVNYKDIKKDEFILELGQEINNYEYNFMKPYYFYSPKSKGILRKIKLYSIGDTSVYYYCVKKIQKELSDEIRKNRLVYGGFRFTPELRLRDEDLLNMTINYEYDAGLSVNNFRKEWSQYQKLADSLSQKNYSYYIHIDIAHFYDDINLDILENKIRSIVNGKSKIIDLLFNFLRFSDKRDLGYIQSNVGIPQEEVGEMSRLLANFYLASYDTEMIRFMKAYFKEEEKFTYTRYADDMWFCFHGDYDDGLRIVQKASFELSKLKLHISENKLEFFSVDKFIQHWHFIEWESMFENKKNLTYLFNLYLNLHTNQYGRWFSLASYILQILISNEKSIDVIFISVDNARAFLDSIVKNPKFIFRLKNDKLHFFKKLLNKYPELRQDLEAHLQNKGSIYPNVEYFILDLLSGISEYGADIDFFINHYFSSFSREYQWYSRCLCLKYIIENLDFMEKNRKESLTKFMNHIERAKKYFTKLERRYVISFLSNLRNDKGGRVLKRYFNTPEDIVFINFLRIDGLYHDK